jgi:hypothetical protein
VFNADIYVKIFMWGLFIIYSAVFSYLADVYGPFASSALAGQSLARNLSGAAFPLFTNQLYGALGFPWSNTLFALLAVALAPVPYVGFLCDTMDIVLTNVVVPDLVLLRSEVKGQK